MKLKLVQNANGEWAVQRGRFVHKYLAINGPLRGFWFYPHEGGFFLNCWGTVNDALLAYGRVKVL